MTTAADPTTPGTPNPGASAVGAVAGAGGPAAGAVGAAAGAATPTAGEEYKSMTPEQFTARIKEAGDSAIRGALKALGIEKGGVEVAKERLAKADALEKAQLSEKEKLDLQLKEATTKASRVDELDKIIADHAKTQFESLPDPLKKYVSSIAGEDPAKRLSAISAARESGVFDALTKPADAKAAEKPANTKAGGTPPAPANGTPEKRPKDMTAAEFKVWESQRLGRLQNPQK